jgi:tRNA pseudouridine38-40 synthase
MPVRRLRFVVSYDGTPFAGWQMQAGKKGTVQGHLEAAFAKLHGGRRVIVHGSGRTDAGVHALAQVAHADVEIGSAAMTRPQAWLKPLNAHLPPEIRVQSARYVSSEFHARFDVRGKIYRYRIWNASIMNPFERHRAWHVWNPLDVAALRAVLRCFVGKHDFAAFAANRGPGGAPATTVRTIRSAKLSRRGPLLTLEFEGDGFLYKMVRLMTGAAVRVAEGKAELAWIQRLLAHPRAAKNNYQAPSDGLYLRRVVY